MEKDMNTEHNKDATGDLLAGLKAAEASGGREAAVRTGAQREDREQPRQREGSFGGLRLKLSVPVQIEGMHMYWVNDDNDGQMEELLAWGFEFVQKSEIHANREARSKIVLDESVDSRVSRFVGKHEDGSPQKAFLLKCSDEVWAENERHKQAQADTWDNQIRNKKTGLKKGEQYVPQGYENELRRTLNKQVQDEDDDN
jgi:hypothetical protein